MRPILAFAACALVAAPAGAALPQGAKAPQIATVGAVGGKAFRLNLRDQLRRGPVVLYFFPAAFTKGCTLEARAFSEAMPEFRKAGARVIGMSADPLDKLRKFSIEECRSAFPVASATPATIAAYDVAWKEKPGLTKRTSYVIGRDGRIVMVHDELDWSQHVAKTLAAVRALK
jgi:peroxiredoxin Q/BCP